MLSSLLSVIAVAASVGQGGGALQSANGSELIGNYVQVSIGTSRNKLFVTSNNMATITSDNGVVTSASWSTLPGWFCLRLGNGRQECWPYERPFELGRTVRLLSDCGASSTWTLRPITH